MSSPNYPQPYPNSRECVWYVTVEPGKRVNITIVDFDMEAHANCSYDMLAVSIFCILLSTYDRCRACSVAGRTVWNSPSDNVRDPDIGSDSFRYSLKTICLLIMTELSEKCHGKA